ncbi:TAXI family TRAP transporter solute-binding subunit [Streptomyces alkaliterrae]|uniref:TAXI family TRAP transporter solute-binding subunit n=1 Tax=Streptomyces alkaliterrae TaxID=2213162 RepID=A0A5P0YQ10_9ACTN|nr:TAXI family TRAP transporter solute-binding subunit [Streptomyces alkaliterrae]MBB1253028.1 TAXI family TRAP transporter solute-binding subunit [Streptomyces alkaliterrae]MBB1260293.1 TAXI family TRAP transporter solute-binding subunit [Streptomyces alkaliterrae]MQS02000.1 TAXI family TRAP transporter solute-binding subunit [Streptomyces alkaliterrae]
MVEFDRRARRGLVSLVAAVLALGLLWWLLPAGSTGPSGSAVFATGARSGVYDRYGILLREQLGTELPDVDLRLRPSQGSVDNIEKLVAGKADFTIAQADAVSAYLTAKGRDADRLRACARLYDDYVQLIVLADSPVRSAADLRGLRVGVGQRQSGVRPVAERLLRAAGLDPVDDVTRIFEGIGTMPRLLEEGKLDAFFWTGGLPTSAVQDLAARTDIRLVELGELVPALHAQDAQARHYRAAVMPADAYPRVQGGQAVQSIAVANLLVTTDRADAALTEGLTRALINSRDRIGRQVHAAQRVDLRTAIYTDPLPLHEGAQRYYRAVKP